MAKKIIIPAGSRVNIPSEISTLQQFTQDNLNSLLDAILESRGILTSPYSGDDSNFQVSQEATPEIKIEGGTAISESADLLYKPNYSKVDTSDPNSTYYIKDQTTVAVYAQYTNVSTTPVEIINELLRANSETYNYSRSYGTIQIVFSTELVLNTFDSNGTSIVLANIEKDGSSLTITDRRDENILKFHDEILGSNVVRKDKDSIIDGYIDATGIYITNDSNNMIKITNTGISGINTVTGASLLTTLENQHTHINDTFVPSDVNVTASGVDLAMKYGVVNFSDGEGDRLILTRKIPSVPNTVNNISGTFLENKPTDVKTSQINATIAAYKAKDLELATNVGAINELNRLTSYMTVWDTENPGLEADDMWADNITLFGTSQLTISGMAQNILDLSYATAEDVGLYLGAGYTPTEVIMEIDNGIISETLTAKDAVNADLTALEAQVNAISGEVEQNPSLGHSQFKLRLTWPQPVLVDNEKIKYYNVKAFRLSRNVASEIFSGKANNPSEMINSYSNNFLPRQFELIRTPEFEEELTYRGESTYTIKTWNKSEKQITFDQNIGLYANTGDFLAFYLADDGGDTLVHKNKIRAVDQNTGFKTYMALPIPASLITSYVKLYSVVSSAPTQHRVTFIDIEAGDVIVVYIQAVTEYGVAGDWSNPAKFDSNDFINGAGQTMAQVISSQTNLRSIIRRAEYASLRREISQAVSDLTVEVAALPTMDHIANLTTVINDLQQA